MSLILVTGTPGWLGFRLVRVLLEGSLYVPENLHMAPDLRVRCLVQRGVDAARLSALGERVEIVEGDLVDPASLARFCEGAAGCSLFHCAGIVHPRNVREFFRINLEGTRNMLTAAEAAGLRRAVCVSSNAPLGINPTREHLFNESSPYSPYLGYGRSKMQMEQHVKEVQARGGLETVIIRPPWFYGPDQPPRQTLFFSMIKRGGAPILGDGNNRRSMVYLDNLIQALILCDRVEAASGQTYWIADRRPYTTNEIVDTIERLLEQEFGFKVAHKRLRLPFITGTIAEYMDRATQSVGLYHQKIHVLSETNKDIACSIAKAERELGYDPKVELELGMRLSIQWCVDNAIQI
jgi:nucleoside-diphosphate-sugar epimerase